MTFIRQSLAYREQPTYFPTQLTGITYFLTCGFVANFITNNCCLSTQNINGLANFYLFA